MSSWWWGGWPGAPRRCGGQTARAIEAHEQALGIAREIGDRQGEETHLGNLGLCYFTLGQTARAIEAHEHALAIDRDIGDRSGEALDLTYLGDCYAALQEWDRARGYQREAIALADDIGFAQARSEAGLALAKTLLFAGNTAAAQQAIIDARDHPFPPTQSDIALVTGIIGLRNDDPTAAADAFRDALTRTDQQLTDTPGIYTALDTSALAHTGLLVLTDDPAHVAQAIAAFRAARAATSAEGVVQGVLRMFDALAVTDSFGVLPDIRTAAIGTRAT